jgi:hypothetical protein
LLVAGFWFLVGDLGEREAPALLDEAVQGERQGDEQALH